MHRINETKWAAQMFKNHFLAGLCTIESQFPMQLWDDLLNQAEIALNLLIMSRVNRKILAYAQLEGPFNFNKTLLAPVCST